MSFTPQPFTKPQNFIAHCVNRWKAMCDRNVANYYNQQVELCPEAAARQYWKSLCHPQSGVDIYSVNDAMLSRLMADLMRDGISKFAVDCFILELRRLVRETQRSPKP